MAERETYEVLAVRYARQPERKRRDNFILPIAGETDAHDVPMPLDYFVWVIRNERRTFVGDTGFVPEISAKRKVPLFRTPDEALATVGVVASEVKDVIISHLHYDHAGGIGYFPKATFHLQDVEMAYATGRHMCETTAIRSFEVEDVIAMVRKVYGGQVRFHDGDAELAPGVSIHKVGGHSAGLMFVRVWTRRGWVVVASDCTHFYENIRMIRPYVVCYNLGEMMNGYNKMNMLAESPDHIIPGHDPLVLEYYPPVSEDLRGIAHRLDVPPVAG